MLTKIHTTIPMPFALLLPLRRALLPLALLAFLPGCATAPPPAPPVAAVLREQVAPGYNGVVLVRASRSSAPVVRAYGEARFEDTTKLAPDTRFMVGSVSKWITAVAVLRLAEEGKLSLDAPITTWLPELPASSSAVTLRHLLSNTSGIPNGLGQAIKRDRSPERLTITPAAAALQFGNGPLAFAPGAQFDYSVTNWLLVGGIVERATGEPFQQVIAGLVFQPAGVADTGFADDSFATLPRTAVAYGSMRAGTHPSRKIMPTPPMVAASGTIYSTASDLLKIADAVYGTALLTPASRQQLLTVQHAPEEYALGGRVRQAGSGAQARVLAWESGVSGGYKTLLAYAPADGRAVVLLNNTDMQQSEQARLALALFEAMQQ